MFDIYFYATHSIDLDWIKSTLNQCYFLGMKVAYGCVSGQPFLSKYNIPFFYGAEAHQVKAPLVVSASTGLKKESFFHKKMCLIHMPHSLISLHMAYPEDAFAEFDCLFAAGPHHVEEWSRISQLKSNKIKDVYAVGYGKLDLMKGKNFSLHEKKILIAPSWGKDNLLETSGKDLILRLIEDNYKVILRPHPMFFIEKKKVLESVISEFPKLEIESSLEDKNETFYTASILITDYSGIAFEYVALHSRRVVFVNTEPKKFNEKWKTYKLNPIELSMRDRIGFSCENTLLDIINAIDKVSKAPHITSKEIKNFIYHPFMCSDYAASILKGKL